MKRQILSKRLNIIKNLNKITQISELINLPDNPMILEKHQYDAFYQTGLDEYLLSLLPF